LGENWVGAPLNPDSHIHRNVIMKLPVQLSSTNKQVLGWEAGISGKGEDIRKRGWRVKMVKILCIRV
jgi:hypothetical protein